MEAPNHEHASEALGAYVLGALASQEREAVEAHVRACAVCRDEVIDLEAAVVFLDRRFKSPPAEVWSSINLHLRQPPHAS